MSRVKGNTGEDLAESFLRVKDYEIIERNFSTSAGEIDIIAAHGGYLIFIEVKLRKNAEFGTGAEAVNGSKIKRISQTASQYIGKYRLFDTDVRFDVIEIDIESGEINHIENAFDSFLWC